MKISRSEVLKIDKINSTPSVSNQEMLSDTELKRQLEEYGFKITNTFQAKNDYVHRKIAGNDILISIGENVANFNGYVEMNVSASCIWDSMKQPCTVSELIKILMETFEIFEVQAMEDVLEFLKVLQGHNMVVVSEE